MTEKEYREHPAISRSELFKISESPEKFKYYQEHPEEPTPSLIFGQLFHAMALQPETVWEQFIVEPKIDKRKKEWKDISEDFEARANGKIIVSIDMVERATAMCEALNENEFVKKLLKGEKEKPFFWVDEMTGIDCKCRTDCVVEIGDMPLIVDLKSATNASTDVFIRDAIKHGYHMQAAMYSEGVKQNTGKEHAFVFVVIEKEPPYSINILQCDKLFLQYGYDVFRECIGTYADCVKNNNFWGYLGRYNQINNLNLPAYLAKEIE